MILILNPELSCPLIDHEPASLSCLPRHSSTGPWPDRPVAAGPLATADALIAEILGPDQPDEPAPGSFRSIYHILAHRLSSPDPAALAPGTEVNRALGRLVRLLTSTFEPAEGNRSAFHWAVVEAVYSRINRDPTLTQRAGVVRRAAAVAESLMEQHYARRLAHGRPVRRGATRVGSALGEVLGAFPYRANYEELVEAERRGLGAGRTPGRIAFCGAGALPLTGVLWHLDRGAQVSLVEIAPEVAELAERFIGHLADVGIVDGRAFEVRVQDARALDPSAFDVVMVASLVPKDDLAAVARRVAGCGPGGPVLLARSARGLASQLAYEAVDLDLMDRCGLTHLGTVGPASSVSPLPLPPGLAIRPGPLLRHVAGPGVLNTTEYFAAR